MEHTGGQDDPMIEEIVRHLDTESGQGVYRMSVTVDETSKEAKTVSHKCCNMYGRPANETVGMLDMYTDLAGQAADEENGAARCGKEGGFP